MLAIRMQRTGRKGHAEFRIIVQESRRTPTSGAIVTQLGHYNPHAKTVVLDKDKTSFYLEHGAQPSDSVVRLLQKESIQLPSWVKLATTKSRTTRNPEKLRKNQPAKPEEPVAEAKTETAEVAPLDGVDEPVAEVPAAEEAASDDTAETEESAAASDDAKDESSDSDKKA